jgi:hypothetical protein
MFFLSRRLRGQRGKTVNEFPWVAIAVAGAANYVLGAVYYTALGPHWLEALGKKKEDINRRDPKPYAIAFVGGMASAFFLAWVMQMTGQTGVVSALALGAVVGIGFCAATAAKHYAFSGAKLKLFLIDQGVNVLGFLLMSTLIAVLR